MSTVPTLDPYGEFFARIWTIDLVCPSCSAVHVELTRRYWWKAPNKARRVAWDPLTAHFQCRMCSALFVLGVVAWPSPFGGFRAPPADHLPKPYQQAKIRELLGPGGFLMPPDRRLKLREPANLIVTEPCACVLDPTGIVTHMAACPVHGRARTKDRLRVTPPG